MVDKMLVDIEEPGPQTFGVAEFRAAHEIQETKWLPSRMEPARETQPMRILDRRPIMFGGRRF
jgi:hypothetical protein